MTRFEGLSVVVPCYNCEKTLNETLESLAGQDWPCPWELVAVDDGSRDGTATLLKGWTRKLPQMRVLTQANQGGGAARNAGIRAALNEVIFVFDSDNLLPPGQGRRLWDGLKESPDLDGVTFESIEYFQGTNPKRRVRANFLPARETLTPKAYFDGQMFPLIHTFGLYTKQSWQAAGAYPTHHNFDTQGFGLRWLMAGGKVRAVPGTTYWHRQAPGEPSYFERAYSGGEYTLGSFLILEEFLDRLPRRMTDALADLDPFQDNGFGNLLEKLSKEALEAGELESFKTKPLEGLFGSYWAADQAQDWNKTAEALRALRESKPESRLLLWLALRLEQAQSKGLLPRDLSLPTARWLAGFQGPRKQLLNRQSLVQKVLRKLGVLSRE